VTMSGSTGGTILMVDLDVGEQGTIRACEEELHSVTTCGEG
jgi:hypothetical protein